MNIRKLPDKCCAFHQLLQRWYAAVRPRNDPADRQLALLAHVLWESRWFAAEGATGMVFDPAAWRVLGLGSDAELVAALEELARPGIIKLYSAKADISAVGKPQQVVWIELPWLEDDEE